MVVIGQCDVCGDEHEAPFECQSCGHVAADSAEVIHSYTFGYRLIPEKFVCRDKDDCYERWVVRELPGIVRLSGCATTGPSARPRLAAHVQFCHASSP